MSRDRLLAALAGGMADRPPVALWRHFPEQDQTAGGLAAATVQWQRDFPGDVVKLMPPGDYPTIDWGLRSVYDGAPGGTRRPLDHPVTKAADWERLPGLDVRDGFNGEMLKAVALARIHAALKPGANFYLRDIVFVSMPDVPSRTIDQS